MFKKTTDTYLPGAKTLEASYYLSQEIYEKEKKRVFEKFWFCLGHVGRIPNKGDYYLIEAMGQPFIVLRDAQGIVRVHYNVCAHRGTLVCKPSGKPGETLKLNRKTLQCHYHGWTYGSDGGLLSAPGMEGVSDFSFSDNGLKSPPVYIWEGFIFISFVDDPEPFETLYAPMFERLSDWKIASLTRKHHETYLVKANWKLIFLNFNECLHCGVAHKTLSKFIGDKSAQNDLSSGPFLGGLMDILGGADSVTSSGRFCSLPLGGELTEKTKKKGYYYTILGNLLLNIHPDYLMYHCLFPQNPSETRVESDWLFHPESEVVLGENFLKDEPVFVWSKTNNEDWELCEMAQEGIASKAYRPGNYSNRESLLIAFDEYYLQLMNDNLMNYIRRIINRLIFKLCKRQL